MSPHHARNLCVMLLLITAIATIEASHPLLCQKWLNNYSRYCAQAEQTNSTQGEVHRTFTSCNEVGSHAARGLEMSSGVYSMQSGPFAHISAYCDIDNQTDGWTVILRRINGTLLFNRSWVEYEYGFGTLTGEFWYGLDKMNFLTSRGMWELHIELLTSKGITLKAQYSHFHVQSSDKQYVMSVSNHSGVRDFLSQSSGRPFTTFDRNNNLFSGSTNCANDPDLMSGWWYTRTCFSDKGLNLNARFKSKGLEWIVDSNNIHFITKIIMKIRQRPLTDVKKMSLV